jgi:hypothetical protein
MAAAQEGSGSQPAVPFRDGPGQDAAGQAATAQEGSGSQSAVPFGGGPGQDTAGGVAAPQEGAVSGAPAAAQGEARAACASAPALQGSSIAAFDPLRVAVCVAGLGRTGFEVSRLLEARYHVVAELATHTVSWVYEGNYFTAQAY